MKLIDSNTKNSVLSEIFDKEKFVLVCDVHKWAYGSKKPPHFDCKKCQMVSFVGLLCNIPPDKREEVVEMLEESVRHLVEMDNRGEIDKLKLYKHPKVTIEKDAIN